MTIQMHNDARLMDAFVDRADVEAFTLLMARHRPAVLRVCRAVLHDDHLAEDASQATFLTFYEKAGSIQDPDALRGWLCGVAYKKAARIRRRSLLRADREKAWGESATAADAAPQSDHDLFQIIRDELDRLPAQYRAPLALCYLEGLTHEQAASRLGWAPGTVKTRLVRGRRLLRDRLDRRKVTLSSALLLLLLRGREVGATTFGHPGGVSGDALHAPAPPTAAPSATAVGASTTSSWKLQFVNWGLICMVIVLVWILKVAAAAHTPTPIPRKPSPSVEKPDLPANLTDVLGVDCS